jgi:hypothetical protein
MPFFTHRWHGRAEGEGENEQGNGVNEQITYSRRTLNVLSGTADKLRTGTSAQILQVSYCQICSPFAAFFFAGLVVPFVKSPF